MHTSVELQGSNPRGVFARGAVVPRVSLQTFAVFELPPSSGAAPAGRVYLNSRGKES